MDTWMDLVVATFEDVLVCHGELHWWVCKTLLCAGMLQMDPMPCCMTTEGLHTHTHTHG